MRSGSNVANVGCSIWFSMGTVEDYYGIIGKAHSDRRVCKQVGVQGLQSQTLWIDASDGTFSCCLVAGAVGRTQLMHCKVGCYECCSHALGEALERSRLLLQSSWALSLREGRFMGQRGLFIRVQLSCSDDGRPG